MLLTELVLTSQAVAATARRGVKIDEIAGLLRTASPAEVPTVVAFLSGELLQRQIGVGYAALSGLLTGDGATGSTAPTLTVGEVDAVFAEVGAVTGAGSQAARRQLLAGLFDRATAGERDFLTRLIAGELHQGALEGVMVEAVARAAGVPAAEVRRAHLLGGSLPAVAAAALSAAAGAGQAAAPAPAASGAAGHAASAALRSFGLQVGRPLRPMLASSASSVAAAFARVSPAAVEWKIDGIRIQVHRDDSGVAVFTRTLDDITARVPEIAEAARALDVRAAVLDGEAVALRPDGRPRPFQITAGRTGSQIDVARQRADVPLTAFFFDLLHLDGTDLIDEPASDRYALLARITPAALLIPRLVTEDVAAAEAFFADAVGRGHEGVVIKSPSALYAAGRRGSEWIKVKPRHTLDLVVLAAEWGHGRRRGWLSNLHLGARDPVSGGLVMLGKTFKGLTDEMLTWQTNRLLELAEPPESRPAGDLRDAWGVLRVRPELVVEVAFDGVQASPRYPGGLALRFARVLRHRPDKAASEADTIDEVRALWAEEPDRN
ncbi:MAG TPA: ATP-dependent DNA ligase [Streptosporangiaceae bacterium]|nr:ATP-dependent DNA ligase [Streptosporangiaceae bacterium]